MFDACVALERSVYVYIHIYIYIYICICICKDLSSCLDSGVFSDSIWNVSTITS